MAVQDTINEIKTTTESLLSELESFGTKGNKAAGKRSRKLTLDLEKKYKVFRKESVLASKGQ